MKHMELIHIDEPVKAEPYHYTMCGLDNVYLMNGYEIHETPYGKGISIKHADELHTAIAMNVVEHRKVLSPKEVRFLRKELGLTQAELADKLGQNSQSVARWEKGECHISGPADRLLRVFFLISQLDKDELSQPLEHLDELLERINEIDAPVQEERMVFHTTNNGWLEMEAAPAC